MVSTGDPTLISAGIDSPSVKSPRNDTRDAEAICEAVTRPTMRFVPITRVELQDLRALHRVRERPIKARTALVNERGAGAAFTGGPRPCQRARHWGCARGNRPTTGWHGRPPTPPGAGRQAAAAPVPGSLAPLWTCPRGHRPGVRPARRRAAGTAGRLSGWHAPSRGSL